MPEWSKGADLRSAIYGCVGSNPTPCSLHDFLYGRDCSHGLMVMTADFESASLGSIPSGSSLKRGGAEEACLAHNQKVGGSKPPSAIK